MRIICYFSTLSLNTGADYFLFAPVDPFLPLVFPAVCARKLTFRLHHWASVCSGFRLGSANGDTSRKLRTVVGKWQGVRLALSTPARCVWQWLHSSMAKSPIRYHFFMALAPTSLWQQSCLLLSIPTWSLFLTISILGIPPILPSLVGSLLCLYLYELFLHTTICIWPLWECHLFLVRIWFILWLEPWVVPEANP